ncbi:MAG: N-acetylmuramoyl-L-alanine amidase [bacterium]
MKKIIQLLVAIMLLSTSLLSAKPFTVVIDAGHGGKDPGAVGKIGQEKDVTLKVALLVGGYIEKAHPDVTVVYTRKTDKYVTLKERPEIANKANGDLFISIHANAAESTRAVGCETYSLGVNKTNESFEIAKRENSVLLLEDNNQESYQGFDPTSPDSYIMFELMSERFFDQSLEMAHYIQKEFSSIKRIDRGVRQAGFWVLHKVKMPSVLIELGFLSNVEEEKFLVSQEGQVKLAKSIFEGFEKYKREYDKRTINVSTENTLPESKKQQETPPATKEAEPKKEPVKEVKELAKQVDEPKKEPETPKSEPVKQESKPTTPKKEEVKNQTQAKSIGIVYKVRVFSLRSPIADTHADMKKAQKFPPVSYFESGGWYKYTCCSTTNYNEAIKLRDEVRAYFKDAFIIGEYKGKIISEKEAIELEKQNK